TANLVAEAVGARNARVFDLINACNSLVDAIDVGDSLIRSGKAERVLVATGERASVAINWQAQTMEELRQSVASLVVGDGGGAVVLEPSDDPGRGLRAREFRSDATQWRHAIGGRFRPGTQACERCGGLLDRTFRCNGRDLFAAAFSLLYPTMETVMARTGWGYDDLDVVFCHQPTKRFVEKAIPFLGGVGRARGGGRRGRALPRGRRRRGGDGAGRRGVRGVGQGGRVRRRRDAGHGVRRRPDGRRTRARVRGAARGGRPARLPRPPRLDR